MFGKKKKTPQAPEPETETPVIETLEDKKDNVKAEPKLSQEEMEDIKYYQEKYQHTYPVDATLSEICSLLFGILAENKKLREDIKKLNEDINRIASEERGE